MSFASPRIIPIEKPPPRVACAPARIVVELAPPAPRAVPAAAAFVMLGIGPTTGWRLIREGRLEAIKIGGATVVSIAEIDRFLATAPRRVPAPRNTEV